MIKHEVKRGEMSEVHHKLQKSRSWRFSRFGIVDRSKHQSIVSLYSEYFG